MATLGETRHAPRGDACGGSRCCAVSMAGTIYGLVVPPSQQAVGAWSAVSELICSDPFVALFGCGLIEWDEPSIPSHDPQVRVWWPALAPAKRALLGTDARRSRSPDCARIPVLCLRPERGPHPLPKRVIWLEYMRHPYQPASLFPINPLIPLFSSILPSYISVVTAWLAPQ